MPADLKDVAALAGVSTATVSRVLNNPEVVTPSTRKKTEAAIEKSGYIPNINAKRLRTQKSRAILVVVPDIADPFCATVVRGVENTAADLGYVMLLGDTQAEARRARIYASMVRSAHVDGLLYLSIRAPYELPGADKLTRTESPIVNICNYTNDHFPTVGIDNVAAARAAVEYLIHLGHRRIAAIAGLPQHPETKLRLTGFRDAVAAHGIPAANAPVAHGDFSFESGIVACDMLLNSVGPRPTAIFCHNDRMALGAMQSLWRKSIQVPRDISIVSFDNLDSVRFSCPPLTTIAQPMYDIGVCAMTTLDHVIHGKQLISVQQVLPVELVVRESTAPPHSFG
jgi:LacI family repressor for deo operon, udp, cdd, tsx, nupC, and nupG